MPLPDATLPAAARTPAVTASGPCDTTRSDTTRSDSTLFDAVLFDLDGVVTDTAVLHAAAWAALFDEVLPELADPPGPRFDPVADYRRMVDGRSREDGVRSVLADRGLTVAEGSPGDAASQRTVHGLSARKQELFAAVVAQRGVVAFPSTVSLLRRLRAQGIRSALVTSSRNSSAILVAAGVAGLFDTVVDGTDAVRLGLAGKPDPATFLEGARRLDVAPARAVVIEDAEAGVRAGAAGNFGLVVGVDRAGNREALVAAGADVVVEDLAALDLSEPPPVSSICGRAAAASSGWRLVYDDVDPAQEGTREVLYALGNGFWATRGAALGTVADGVHYPGTYLAGVYNRLETDLADRSVEDEHLVNGPDWTSLTLTAEGSPLRPGAPSLLSSHRELDLRRGLLTWVNRYRDTSGRTTRVVSRQLVSQAQPRLAGLEVVVQAEDWTGALVVRCGLDGQVRNHNVAEFALLADRHLLPVAASEPDPQTVLLDVVTSQSGVHIALAARTRFRAGADELSPPRHVVRDGPAYIGHEVSLAMTPGRPVTIDKVVAVATSREPAVSTASLAAADRIAHAPSFGELLLAHDPAWRELWQRFAVTVGGGQRQSLALNLNTFHVLQAVAAADADLDAGVPARGLHGEGYRGHIFWDELFVYPLLTLRRPELTRALLLYRCRRLPAARAAARAAGLDGAMFPWQSGSDGREETPTVLFNTRTGQWMPDNSHRQRHVGLAVAYSVWQYYQATGDVDFLIDHGVELLVEVTRLFASLAAYDPADDRFDIDGVMGPDEFHDGPPGAPGTGLRNNAYTNVLAAWVITKTAEALELLATRDCARLWRRLRIGEHERARWEHLSRRLRVPFHTDGVISQFEGYEHLAELDWARYRARYGDVGRLDLILQAEGDSPNNYRLSKQADVLMLFYLLSMEELRDVLDQLGYPLPVQAVRDTVEFYLARASNGSTLSRLVHSWVMIRADRPRSWSLSTQALTSDLDDLQRGTTKEGVHLGAMAGTVDLVLRGYAGVETRGDLLRLHPVLPPELPGVGFELVYRGQPISVELTATRARLTLHPSSTGTTRVCVEDQMRLLRPGQVFEVAIHGAGTA